MRVVTVSVLAMQAGLTCTWPCFTFWMMFASRRSRELTKQQKVSILLHDLQEFAHYRCSMDVHLHGSPQIDMLSKFHALTMHSLHTGGPAVPTFIAELCTAESWVAVPSLDFILQVQFAAR